MYQDDLGFGKGLGFLLQHLQMATTQVCSLGHSKSLFYLVQRWKHSTMWFLYCLVSTNDLTCWVGNLWHKFVKGCTVVEVWVGELKFNGICYKWVWLFWNLKDWWATKLYLVCSQVTCTARNILWPLSLYHCAYCKLSLCDTFLVWLWLLCNT